MNEDDRERMARFEEKIDNMAKYEEQRDVVFVERVDKLCDRIDAINGRVRKNSEEISFIKGWEKVLTVIVTVGIAIILTVMGLK